ncbi:hypothetical protein QVD17_09016 [Tagetes erecta]|uniref:Uncharacterized protein n=1 Tax=Tagetes erecta TaxID=13708 RepID=A0AAD8KYK3_TARER|nr:hypothetical protein QVD17_09016 [Tagetes erecta]
MLPKDTIRAVSIFLRASIELKKWGLTPFSELETGSLFDSFGLSCCETDEILKQEKRERIWLKNGIVCLLRSATTTSFCLRRSATTTSSITHRHQNNTPRSVFVYAFRHQPNGDVFPAFLPDKAAVYGDGFRRLFWRLSVSHLFSEFCLELDVWVLVRSVAVVIVG